VRQLERKIKDKIQENNALDEKLEKLKGEVNDRTEISNVAIRKGQPKASNSLKDIYTRRRLVDLAKSQSQDIAILRSEVEKLRLRTYPAFHAS
jgi:hypothetical protein